MNKLAQWQQLFYGTRYTETPIWSPDYTKLAEAYGIPGYRVEKIDDIVPAMDKVRESDGPALIEFVVDQYDMVYPMVPAGADLHEMIRRPYPVAGTRQTATDTGE